MKTSDLIDLLATGAGPAPRYAVASRFAIATVAGALGAAVLLITMLGINPALQQDSALAAFWMKIGFAGTLTLCGLLISVRLARPGRQAGGLLWLMAPPVLLAWSMAALTLMDAPPESRRHLLLGDTWRTCPWLIALLSVPTLAASMWALRGLAPTALRPAGAALGLFAGAMGACVYGLHCPELSAPFMAIWYLAGMMIPSVAGYAVAPSLLRW